MVPGKGLEHAPPHVCRGGHRGLRQADPVERGRELTRFGGTRPDPVDGPGASHHQQPSDDRRPARLVLVRGAPDLGKHLLHHLFRIGIVAKNPASEPVDRRGVAVVQLGSRVPFLRPRAVRAAAHRCRGCSPPATGDASSLESTAGPSPADGSTRILNSQGGAGHSPEGVRKGAEECGGCGGCGGCGRGAGGADRCGDVRRRRRSPSRCRAHGATSAPRCRGSRRRRPSS